MIFWMSWLVLTIVAIVMMGVKDDAPVTDAEWIEWQEYCKERKKERT